MCAASLEMPLTREERKQHYHCAQWRCALKAERASAFLNNHLQVSAPSLRGTRRCTLHAVAATYWRPACSRISASDTSRASFQSPLSRHSSPFVSTRDHAARVEVDPELGSSIARAKNRLATYTSDSHLSSRVGLDFDQRARPRFCSAASGSRVRREICQACLTTTAVRSKMTRRDDDFFPKDPQTLMVSALLVLLVSCRIDRARLWPR